MIIRFSDNAELSLENHEVVALVKQMGAINIDDEGGFTLATIDDKLSDEVKDYVRASVLYRFYTCLKKSTQS